MRINLGSENQILLNGASFSILLMLMVRVHNFFCLPANLIQDIVRKNDREDEEDPFFRKMFREYIKMAIRETTTRSLLKSAWMIEDARKLRASKRSLYWQT